jgi:hypothetical protein
MAASANGEYFLARLEAATGRCLWSRHFGATGYAYVEGLAVDANDIYVTGGFTGTFGSFTAAGGEDVFISKHDASGMPVWTKAFGGPADDYATGIAVRGTRVVVGGTFTGTVSFGGAPLAGPSGFLASYALNGNHQWSRSLGGSVSPNAIVIDSNDRVTIAGSMTGTVNPGGDVPEPVELLM